MIRSTSRPYILASGVRRESVGSCRRHLNEEATEVRVKPYDVKSGTAHTLNGALVKTAPSCDPSPDRCEEILKPAYKWLLDPYMLHEM